MSTPALHRIGPGLAANADTFILDTSLSTVIGCLHCGGTKQVIQRIGADWTMQQVQINEDYYRKTLFPCVCQIDQARARSLVQEIESLRETNLELAQAKAAIERRIEQLFNFDTHEQEAGGQ